MNIALVNELAMFAHDPGIDVWEAIDAASTKPFGYLRFTPRAGSDERAGTDLARAKCPLRALHAHDGGWRAGSAAGEPLHGAAQTRLEVDGRLPAEVLRGGGRVGARVADVAGPGFGVHRLGCHVEDAGEDHE